MKKITALVFALTICQTIALTACNKQNNETVTAAVTSETTVTTLSETTDASVSETEEKPAEHSDFEYSPYGGKAYIKAYTGSETAVVIPEEIDGRPVTKYYSNAFEGCNITEMTFPSTITEITKLSGTESLKTLNLPKTLKSVAPKYIAACPNLQNINIEGGGEFMSADGVLYTADGKSLICFPAGRTGEFTVPDGVETIGESAFTGSSLTKVTLPKGVVKIEKYAFSKSKLSEIILHEGLAEIDNYAFEKSGLKSAVLPQGLTKIGDSAFKGCPITKITLPEGLKEIGTNAFSQTKLTELYIPDSIERCGNILGSSSDIAVSAPLEAAYGREADLLTALPNVTFRGDTVLKKAMRAAPEHYDEYYKGRVFVDINGDNFPELVDVYKYNKDVYRYNAEENKWRHFWNYHDENIELYYDKGKDEYFYLLRELGEYAGDYFYKKICTEDISEQDLTYIGGFDGYSIGDYFFDEYFVEESVDFGTLNGKYCISENDPNFVSNAVKDAMSEYELVLSVNIDEIVPKESGERYEITVGDFADEPQTSPYISEKHEEKQEKEPLVTIGDYVYTEDTYGVYLDAEDTTPENFEKLSRLPKLTELHVGGGYGDNESTDLKGIGVLTNLRELYAWGTLKNASEIGKLKNLSVLYMSADADDLTFLTGMDSVVVMGFDDTADKPEDFYEPLYGMKNMRCLLLSTWERYMTAEQYKHIRENAPHIKIFMYKRG